MVFNQVLRELAERLKQRRLYSSGEDGLIVPLAVFEFWSKWQEA